MALLLMDGFEFAPTFRSNYGLGASAVSNPGRDGIGLSLAVPNSLNVPLPSAVATLVMGVGWMPGSGAPGNTTAGGGVFLFGDAGATTHLCINIASSGVVLLRRGAANGTIMATGAYALSMGTWHWLEVKATISDTVGICIVKVDGIEQINFTGDTKNAGTNNSIDMVQLGTLGSPAARYDDLVICDGTGGAPFNDFFGEKAIRAKRPNNNGATNTWVGSDGNSTDNYLLVDDVPPSSTDYTASATTGNRDLYALSNAASMTTVDAIQHSVYAAKSDAGSRQVKTVTRLPAGTVTLSPAVMLSTTYQLLAGAVEQTDPAGAAWTPTSVNTVQGGVEAA